MTEHDHRLLEALLRTDFLTFAQRVSRDLNPGRHFHVGWHHEAIVDHLLLAATHQIDRVVINLPPRSAKSTIVSVALPAFLLGQDPTRRIVVVSYNQDLALHFSRQTRQVMQSEWYRRLFPATNISMRAAEGYLHTAFGGFRKATSVGGAFTGRGGDLIIIDDPLKADDAYSAAARQSLIVWASATLPSRLDEKVDGAMILVQQRQHEDDLAGHWIRNQQCLVLSLPAIAEIDESFVLSRNPTRWHHRKAGELLDPVREPQHVLDSLKREMGTAAFLAQYQQAPVPIDGEVVKPSWFRTYDLLPGGGELVFSVDTASKAGLRNDWSVVTIWRIVQNRAYLVDVWRRRVEYPELRLSLRELAEIYEPDTILIEDKGTGIGLIQDLRDDPAGYPVVAYDPGALDKESRIRIQSAKIEGGLVFVPADAPWLADFLAEFQRFPNGVHDDQVDAVSQLLDFKFSQAPGKLLILR